MKKASKEAYAKDIKVRMNYVGNIFLTKPDVSLHKAMKRAL